MSDIFLSYASPDFERIRPLAATLSAQGWSVFYDRTIPPSKTWRQYIGQEIDECRCMVVVWSNHSIEANWVLEEADDGLRRKILVPLFLDQVKPPRGFREIQAANLVGWQGDPNAPGIAALCGAITELIGAKNHAIDFNKDSVTPANISSGIRTYFIKDPLDPGIWRLKTILKVLFTVMVVSLISMIRQAYQPVPIKIPEMVSIPAGEFWMGSADDEKHSDHQKPRRKVRVAAFGMGKYEVTKAQFAAFAESTGEHASGCWSWDGSQWIKDPKRSWSNPGFEQSDKDPVTCVSHEDAIAYIRWLNTRTGKHFRLPTEAEWEYALRAGSTGDYFWGNANATEYAWFSKNSNGLGTVPVDDTRFKPNAFGLYHMAGNVNEWVADCWHASYEQAPINADSTWLSENAGDCTQRVLRGGSWSNETDDLRSATRGRNYADGRDFHVGFRLAQDLP